VGVEGGAVDAEQAGVVDPNTGQLLRFLRIPAQQRGVDLLSWCAINPVNRYLYTSEFGGPGTPDVTRVLAYELADPLTRGVVKVAVTSRKRACSRW
jgi:hypothetical protein